MNLQPELSPEESESRELMEGFLDTRSWDEARQFAVDHQELRDIGWVTILVNTAQQVLEADQSGANDLYQRAVLLCGSDDPDVAALVAHLVGYASAMADGPPTDRELASSFLELTDSEDTIGKVSTAHHRIRAQLFDHLASAVENLAQYTNDPRPLLNTAVGLAQAAVDATPEISNDRPGRLNNLVVTYEALYAATGSRDHLLTAIGHAQTAVDTTPADSNDRPMYLTNLANCFADLYAATGSRDHLLTAIGHAQTAVDTTPADSSDLPRNLNNLAATYAALHTATGNQDHLLTAIGHAQTAVDTTPANSIDRPMCLNNLAAYYANLYRATENQDHLLTAIGHAQTAVDTTPSNSIARAGYLSNLANCFADLHTATGNQDHLLTAIGHAQTAVDTTPADSNDRPMCLNNLAANYADLHSATGDKRWLNEGLSILASSPSPLDALKIERTRARLLVGLDRCGEAALVLEAAAGLLEEERFRLGDDLEGLRDLAGAINGMTSELAFLHARLQDPHQSVKVLERPRIWLSPPPELRASPAVESPAVWVIPSQWGTAVIARIDGEFTATETAITQDDLSALVVDVLNAQRSRSGSEATRDLIENANPITALFPPVDRLLVVPIGVASLIPWYACGGPSGQPLVGTTTITVAPTLAWANTKPVSAGEGPPVGFFHPGISGSRGWLELGPDRRSFVDVTDGTPLNSPNLASTLRALEGDASIGHFSCHAGYNHLDPLGSAIQLADPVTLRDLHNLGRCPPLINLSACETGIPDLSRSEQALSFPTSFLRAGANHVVGTLWPIRNDIATAFNTAFYTHHNNGSDPATACRQAIQSLIAQRLPITSPMTKMTSTDPTGEPVPDETWFDPSNWAAFTHYGNLAPG